MKILCLDVCAPVVNKEIKSSYHTDDLRDEISRINAIYDDLKRPENYWNVKKQVTSLIQ